MKAKRLIRKADQFLRDWKDKEGHKPLIVKGARQIGKTECIRELGKSYASFVEINFKLEPQFRAIVSSHSLNTAEAIIKEISNIDPSKRFLPHHTLILFDEIQAFPEICTSLKSFRECGQYDVICSGSPLGINYASISSIAVGNKEDYDMFGLDFEEFLWAKGYPSSLRQELLERMVTGQRLSDAMYETLRSLFYDFTALGGMPEVDWNYIQSGNFSGSLDTQKQILLDYRDDMKQYAGGLDKTKIEAVFDAIPAQLGKENPKFMITKVRPKASGREFGGVKEWLADSGIALISYGLNFPELPLKGNYQLDNYRIYLADTGLLIASLDEEAQEDFRQNKNFGVHKGAVYENLVADAFHKQGLPLYFYKRPDGTLEEDFFARTKKHLVPIETKAKNGRSKSLRTLIDLEKYSDISFGIKLADANISSQNGVITFPHFLSFLVKDYLKTQD